MSTGRKGREPRATALLISVALHLLVGLGVAASSWWWGKPALEVWKTHTVSLVDAPLSLQSSPNRLPVVAPQTRSVPKSEGDAPKLPASKVDVETPESPVPKAEVKAPVKSPPKAEAKAPVKSPPKAEAKAPVKSPPKAEAKAPVKSPPKAEAKAPVKSPPKAEAKAPVKSPPKAEAKAPVKSPPKAEVKAPVKSREPSPASSESASQTASSQEARSAIEALRQRQVQREQAQRQAVVARQQAAADRVSALRNQLEREDAVGGAAVTAAGVHRVRLMAYQDRVRAKIIEAWILPLSAEQRRDLQATTQFRVGRNGEVTQLELVQPSGNTLFDASLLRAIRRASPLPSLPEDYPVDVLEVEMRFRASS